VYIKQMVNNCALITMFVR